MKEDIRKVVMIQRLGTLDSACVLVLVQEEANESTRGREYRRYEPSAYRGSYKPALSRSRPPKFDKYDDKKHMEQQKPNTSEDKLKALKQYRRARGLRDTCAKKWSYGHKCYPQIQLHVV
jgi:hypothetical protein